MSLPKSLRPSCLLALVLALAGCVSQQTAPNSPPLPSIFSTPATPASPATGKTGGAVALLVPLTGPLAPVGQALQNAAKLAFTGSTATLDIRDTAGTATGAAAAAQAAITAGDGIILGPLTGAETQSVAPLAKAAGVNVLAFTNDSRNAAPGLWTLGITPAQQVSRVVQAAAGNGRTQLAGLLPDDVFGHALATAITTATAGLSEPTPNIAFYPATADFSDLNDTVRGLSDFADRGQSLEAQIKAAQELGTAAGRETARQLQHQPIPPPAFNALFIGATDDETLAEIATLLPFYAVGAPQVQLLGPALWAPIAAQMAHQGVYNGALYAAPDPAAAAAFDAKYQSAYGAAPPAIADIGFDAAAIAVLASSQGGFTSTVLTAASGFTGTDGVLLLLPDGEVQRGLAVFQIAPGAPAITSPAPAQLTAPAS